MLCDFFKLITRLVDLESTTTRSNNLPKYVLSIESQTSCIALTSRQQASLEPHCASKIALYILIFVVRSHIAIV